MSEEKAKNPAKENPSSQIVKPSRKEAEKAVQTLLRWAGDDPSRPGLINTPDRVVRAYEEYFRGYNHQVNCFSCAIHTNLCEFM